MGNTRQFEGLSPRELQILNLYSRGRCAKEIATALDIRYHTVGTYKKRIMKKLELENHCQFLVSAIRFSLTPAGKKVLRRSASVKFSTNGNGGNGRAKPRRNGNGR